MGKPKKKLTKYNKCMSRELKGNMSGKTKAQRAALFKAAAKLCSSKTPKKHGMRGLVVTRPKSGASTSKSNPSGGTRNMTKNSLNMSKIYGLVRKVAIFIPAITLAMTPAPMEQKIKVGTKWYFGWDTDTGTFSWQDLWKGWGPAVGAQVITRVIPAINRIIRSFL